MDLAWLATTARDAFHTPRTATYRRVTSAVNALIAVSVSLLFVEVAAPWALEQGSPLWVLDRGILACFALELLVRVATYVPPQLAVHAHSPGGRLRVHVLGRLRFLLRPMMLVDLVTILGAAPGLRGLRAIGCCGSGAGPGCSSTATRSTASRGPSRRTRSSTRSGCPASS